MQFPDKPAVDNHNGKDHQPCHQSFHHHRAVIEYIAKEGCGEILEHPVFKISKKHKYYGKEGHDHGKPVTAVFRIEQQENRQYSEKKHHGIGMENKREYQAEDDH